jgi:hypothetical protein
VLVGVKIAEEDEGAVFWEARNGRGENGEYRGVLGRRAVNVADDKGFAVEGEADKEKFMGGGGGDGAGHGVEGGADINEHSSPSSTWAVAAEDHVLLLANVELDLLVSYLVGEKSFADTNDVWGGAALNCVEESHFERSESAVLVA